MNDPILVLHELACAALFFSVFCRLTHMDGQSLLIVRFSFWLLGVVALAGMAWPILGWPLALYGVALTVAIVVVQVVTATYWHRGTPSQFQHTRRPT